MGRYWLHARRGVRAPRTHTTVIYENGRKRPAESVQVPLAKRGIAPSYCAAADGVIFHVCRGLPGAADSWLAYSLLFHEVYAAKNTRHLHVVYKFTGPRCVHLGNYTRTPMLSVADSDTHAIVCDTAAANPQIRPCRRLCVSTLPSKMNFGYCILLSDRSDLRYPSGQSCLRNSTKLSQFG